MALTPPPAAPQRGDRTTFAQRVDAFITWIINFVTELGALVANLNSIAAGGAYAIPFNFSDAGSVIGGGGGVAVNDYTAQSAATALYASSVDAQGLLVKLGFDDIFYVGATSAVKGYIKLTKVGDPSKWIRLRVTSYAWVGSYGQFGVVVAGFSAANPFVLGDALIMDCQRTGDKGDKGDPGASQLPAIYVRDEKGQGAGAGLFNASVVTRALNTTKINTIPGASLANNRVTVPPGYYNILGRAPAYNVRGHRVGLWNVTTGTLFEIGSSMYAYDGSDIAGNTSVVEARHVQLATQTTFELRHYVENLGGTNAQGFPSGQAYLEVYAELIFQKAG